MTSEVKMYTYSLYGLKLQSNQPLPMLDDVPQSTPHVDIDFQSTARRMPSEGAHLLYELPLLLADGKSPLELWRLASDSGYWLRSMIGRAWAEYFLASDGSRVEVMVREETSVSNLIQPLMGLVIPLVLRLRGVTCLHASAVLVDGQVVVFAGPSETGKSTTLLAMLRRGHSFFSDDLVPLYPHEGTVLACAGYAQVGVLPDTMSAFFGANQDLPYLWDEAPQRPDKRIYRPDSRSHSIAVAPHPLAAVYLLARRRQEAVGIRISSMTSRDAIAQLVPHTTGRALAGAAGRAADLARLSELVRTVPVRLIERADDLTRIDELATAIDADIAMLAGQAVAAIAAARRR